MKKLVVFILAAFVLLFAFAGCSEGEVHTPPSLAFEDTTPTAQTAQKDVTQSVPDESRNPDAPVSDDDDLEIMTAAETTAENSQSTNTPDLDSDSVKESKAEETETQSYEEETTEAKAIILPFVPAE